MIINLADVEKTAKLAHLAISDLEKKMLLAQLDEILAYAQSLSELKTDDIEPTANAFIQETTFHKDIPEKFDNIARIISNACDSKDNFFIVPKI